MEAVPPLNDVESELVLGDRMLETAAHLSWASWPSFHQRRSNVPRLEGYLVKLVSEASTRSVSRVKHSFLSLSHLASNTCIQLDIIDTSVKIHLHLKILNLKVFPRNTN